MEEKLEKVIGLVHGNNGVLVFEKMKRISKYIAFVAFASFSVSCVEEQFGNESTNPIGDPNAIQFGASTNSMETKTVFGDKVGTGSDAYWQVFWDNTEEYVEIFCPDAYNMTEEDVLLAEYEVKAINKAADGTVSDAAAGTSSKGQITPRVAGKYLKWGGDSGKHRFYAAYPAKCAYISQHADSVGIMTFKINNNQVCTIPTNATSPFVAEPDMDYAYMVGTGEGEPASGKVALDFDPIMTTLTVTVTAAQTNLDASTTITGISIISSVASVDALNGIFKYNAKSGSVLLGQTTTPKTVSTFVGIKHGDSNHIDLKSGESVTFTVFLPPVGIGPIDADNPAQSPIEIRVHRTGNANLSAYIGKSKEEGDSSPAIYAANKTIKPSTKCSVVLPSLPAPDATATGNNWITPLDDNIYVSQLSIPGTHDAATYSGTIGNLGQTQAYSIDQQWDMGIRAFDFRPALFGTWYIVTWSNLKMWNWHGVTKTDLTFEAGIDAIINKMTVGSDTYSGGENEFAIVIFKHENEIGLDIDWNWGIVVKNTDTDTWQEEMQKILEKYKDHLVLFRPDLTISECRGKIIMLCRDWTPYTDTGVPTYGGYMGWSHNRNGSKVEEIYGRAGKTGKANFYVQDCFEADEAGLSAGETFLEVKAAAIKNFLDESAKFHIDESLKNTWIINHTSGYSDNTLISGTMEAYQHNAQYQNPRFYSYLTGTTVQIGDETINEGVKPIGSTGIVIMDWVGTRKINGYTVYGDLLPQAVIDNNYKYVMKRKGD